MAYTITEGRKVHELLKATYPTVFGDQRVPLKIGIHKDILAAHPEIDPKALGAFMRYWARGWGYLRALQEDNAMRVDLTGEAAGAVTDGEKADAARNLSYSRARKKAAPVAEKVNVNLKLLTRAFEIMNRMAGNLLLGEDAEFAKLMLDNHPDRQRKMSAGIQNYAVWQDKKKPHMKSFAIMRPDGSLETFSVIKSLKRMAKTQAATPEGSKPSEASADEDKDLSAAFDKCA